MQFMLYINKLCVHVCSKVKQLPKSLAPAELYFILNVIDYMDNVKELRMQLRSCMFTVYI